MEAAFYGLSKGVVVANPIMAKPTTSAAFDVKLQLLPPKIKPLISPSTLNPQILAIRQQQEVLRETHEKQLVQYLTESKFVERLAEVVKAHVESGMTTNLMKSFDSNPKFIALALRLAQFLYKLYPYWTVKSTEGSATLFSTTLFYYAGLDPITSNQKFSLGELELKWFTYAKSQKLHSEFLVWTIWEAIEDAVANHYILIQQSKLPQTASSLIGGSSYGLSKANRKNMLKSQRRFILPPRVYYHAPDIVLQSVLRSLSRVGGACRKEAERDAQHACGGKEDSCQRCVVRYRGFNIRKDNRGRRNTQKGQPRGRYSFRIWNTDWTPLIMDGEQLVISSENSNSGAKKVVTALKQAGAIEVGDPDFTDFYMTSLAELDPDRPEWHKAYERTRFYHYEGRFVPRKRTIGKEKGRKSYQVEGIAEVQAFEGERFSVPFTSDEQVKEAVNKVLSGQLSIRAIQRQSLLYNKPKAKREQFIKHKLNPPAV